MSRVVQLRNIKRALRLEPSDSVSYVISGRVTNFRRYRSFNFIDLVDGSSDERLQVVIGQDLLKKPELGSYLTCRGQIVPSRGSQQATEFKASHVNYLGACQPDQYPLAEAHKQARPDGWFRRRLHLRPRADHFGSMLRVRSELELSMHMILKQMDFFKVHVPVLTANDSEASSDLFMVQRSKQLLGRLQPRASGAGDRDCEGEDADDTDGTDDDDDDDELERNSDAEKGHEAAARLGEQTETQSQSQSQSEAAERKRRRILTGGYFGDKQVFMVTSAQLHLECLAASLSRVYSLGPTFRAESSLSRRHLCEFTMLETEESNLCSLGPLMDRAEALVKFGAQYLGEISEFKSDFASLLDKYSNDRIYEKLAHTPHYVRMTYDEAVSILQKLELRAPLRGPSARSQGASRQLELAQESRQNTHVRYGCDINRQHERQLLEYCDNVPIFITNYPKSLKPFYMKACDGRPDKVENFDLIAPVGGEICGGSLREDNLLRLRENLRAARPGELERELGSEPEGADQRERRVDPFAWYLELREFGTFPHGGFGIGFERLIQSLLGVKNIRDTLAFPRWRGHCSM